MLPQTLKRALLFLSVGGVFIATYAWAYAIAGVILWICMFGDNSPDFGKYAIAIAIPASTVVTLMYWQYCIHNDVSMRFQMTGLVLSLFLIALFFFLVVLS